MCIIRYQLVIQRGRVGRKVWTQSMPPFSAARLAGGKSTMGIGIFEGDVLLVNRAMPWRHLYQTTDSGWPADRVADGESRFAPRYLLQGDELLICAVLRVI